MTAFSVFLARQQIRARGLGGAAQAAPHVHLERQQVEPHCAKRSRLVDPFGQRERAA
jgi:hypothetical protein